MIARDTVRYSECTEITPLISQLTLNGLAFKSRLERFRTAFYVF